MLASESEAAAAEAVTDVEPGSEAPADPASANAQSQPGEERASAIASQDVLGRLIAKPASPRLASQAKMRPAGDPDGQDETEQTEAAPAPAEGSSTPGRAAGRHRSPVGQVEAALSPVGDDDPASGPEDDATAGPPADAGLPLPVPAMSAMAGLQPTTNPSSRPVAGPSHVTASAASAPPDVSRTEAVPLPDPAAGAGAKVGTTSVPGFGEHLAKAAGDVPTPIASALHESAPQIGPADAALSPPALGLPGQPLGHGAAVGAGHAASGSHPVVDGVPVSAVPVEIGLKSLAGVNRFDIRLDPGDLGQIEVRLDISGDGHVRAHIMAERPEALAQLQRESPQLERAFEQAGLKTGGEGISLSLRQQGQGEAGGGRGDGSGSSPQPPAPFAGEADSSTAAPQVLRRYTFSRASGIDRHI